MTADEKEKPKHPGDGRSRGLMWLGIAVLLAATWGSYIPALRAGFIWDDDSFLYDNPGIRSLAGPGYFWKLWGEDRPPDYFPLTSTMMWAEWHWLWGGSPTGYHVVNVALHAAGALLLWAVLRKLGLPASASWLGAMLFALHPVNVESVAWITERKNTLPLPLLLGSLWCWLCSEEEEGAKNTRRWRWTSLALFILSMLAKTAGVMLPVVMLVIAWWRRGRVGRRELWSTAPFFAVSVILGAVTAWYQHAYSINDVVVRTDGFLSRLAIAGRAVLFYMGKALWPVGLSFNYSRWPAAAVGEWETWLPLAALAAAGAALWWMRRRPWSRAALAALAVYVLMLLPILGFVNIFFMRYSLVSDHWQYFAMPALLALAAAGAAALSSRCGAVLRWALVGVTTAVLALCGVMTWRQAGTYHDLTTLWHATMKQTPNAWLPYNNLGGRLLLQGRYDESMVYLKQAIAIDPSMLEAYNNLGTAYYGKRDIGSALECYIKATRAAPTDAESLCNAGMTLVEMGREAEGLVYMQRAVDAVPQSSQTHYKYGIVLAGMGQYEEAMEQYKMALSIRPSDPFAHNNLGGVLVMLDRLDEAVDEFRAALRINPQHPGTGRNLAKIEAERRHRSILSR